MLEVEYYPSRLRANSNLTGFSDRVTAFAVTEEKRRFILQRITWVRIAVERELKENPIRVARWGSINFRLNIAGP
ncbi:hypothetical protein [Hymenobacter setariae]|uniref:hypothetical protein n=1 Tax=Hymenobacter setariae TaxID=2594794 RepID=UPI001F40CD52|nr:hypothetical protein [Hymenobacter setariae]